MLKRFDYRALHENGSISISRRDVKRFAAIRQNIMSITARRAPYGGNRVYKKRPHPPLFFSVFLARETHLSVNGERRRVTMGSLQEKYEFARRIKTNGIFHDVRLPVTSRRF